MVSSLRARLAWIGVLGWVVACSPTPPEGERVGAEGDAIINGAVDAGHPAVVAYLHDGLKCSATIVAVKGNVGYALTAGHCIGQSLGQIYQGQDYSKPVAVYNVTAKAQHFNYSKAPLFDFGMLKFSGATAQTPVLSPIPANLDDVKVGTQLDAVGFGLTQDQAGDTTIRHHKVMPVKTVTDLRFIYDQTGGGICQGDSGGPSTYVKGTEYVAGVHSSVSQNGPNMTCLFEGNDVRVSAVVDTFITPYINGTGYGQQTCAQCTEAGYAGPCNGQVKACFNNADCSAYDNCIQGCATNACVVDCKNKHPSGLQIYNQIFACICGTACAAECAQATYCNQPKCGLTSGKAGCQGCFESSCCAQAQACAASNTCLTCFNSVFPAANCKTDPTTVAFTQCLAGNCSQACGISSSSSSSSTTAATTSAATTSSTGSGAGGMDMSGETVSADSSSSAGGAAPQEPIVVSDCAYRPGPAGSRALALVLGALALTSMRRGRSSTRRRAARNTAA